VWSLADLALAPGAEWRWPMLYCGRELFDRLLPAVLEWLLSRNRGMIAWSGCSTLLVAPLHSAELPEHDADAVGAGPMRNDFGVLPSVLEIDQRMLQIYREALAEFSRGKTPEPPSPFGPAGEDGFLEWWNGPAGESPNGVTRYMMAVREERADVRQAFPDP